MADQAVNYLGAQFVGPFDMSARLLDAAAAAATEGLWTFAGFAKAQSLEISGSMSTLAVGVYGSNAPASPLNSYVVTVGGSATQGDTLTLVFKNANLPAGTHTVTYAVGASPSVNGIAGILAALVAADPVLAALGFTATAAAAVITITYPSVPPAGMTTNSPPANLTTLTSGVGGGTETLTVAASTNGTQIGSNIAALGFTALTTLSRWITVRLTTLTGTNAAITADWHGVA